MLNTHASLSYCTRESCVVKCMDKTIPQYLVQNYNVYHSSKKSSCKLTSRIAEFKVLVRGMKTTSVLCLLSALFMNAAGLDVVFDIPAKLRHDTTHNVILTTFDAVLGRHFTVRMTVRTNGAVIFNQQHSVIAAGTVDTHHFPLLVAPTTSQCGGTDATAVLCDCVIEVSVEANPSRSWRTTKTVPITRKKGHIFIETDRTVYRPGDTVNIRFIPVDDQLKPLPSSMSMFIYAPNPTPGGAGVELWKKNKVASNGVFTRSFKLSETPPLGKWQITARFHNRQIDQTRFESTFFVQDYTLPTFEVKVEPSNFFILPHDTRFQMRISASYIHGEQVQGAAHIRFVLPVDGDGSSETRTTRIITRDSFSREFVVDEPISTLTNGVSLSELIRRNSRLMILVSVTDRAQGNTRTIHDTRVIFTNTPVVLGFGYTPGYYKPGLTFSLQVTAKYIDGRVAPNMDVNIAATAQRTDGQNIQVHKANHLTCDDDGSLLVHFDSPTNAGAMLIMATGTYTSPNGRSYPTPAEKYINPQTSAYDEHIQIVLPRSDLVVDAAAAIEVYVTPSPRQRIIVYTVTGMENVLVEGKVVVSANENQAVIRLHVTSHMSPRSHITAYYVTPISSGGSYITADSAVLRVAKACRGTEPQLQINFPGDQLPYPGQELSIGVRGQSSAYVGLTGVDVAALSLRKDFLGENETSSSNSRLSTFNVLQSFGLECKSLSMPSPQYAFNAVGRTLASSVTNGVIDASSSTCDDVTAKRRRKRDLFGDSQLMIQKAEKYYGSVYECCEIGALDVSSVVNIPSGRNYCEERRRSLSLNEECENAFMSCCAEAKCRRDNPNDVDSCTRLKQYILSCVNGHDVRIYNYTFALGSDVRVRVVSILPGSNRVGTPIEVQRTEPWLRREFDETWFSIDFRLGSRGYTTLNSSSNPRIPALPHSVTSWSLGLFTLSPENGMCVMDPFVFNTEHSIFMEVSVPTRPVVRGTKVSVEVTVFSYIESRVTATIDIESTEGLCGSNTPGTSPETITMNPSSGGIPSSEFLRFTVIPVTTGDLKVKIILKKRQQGERKPSFVDKVVKVLQVVSEGERQRKVEWILVDTKAARLRRQRPSTSRTSKKIKLAFPSNAIPGTEKATMHLHGVSSAATKSPTTNDGDATIAQHLYSLQSTSVKLEYLRSNNLLNGRNAQIESLTTEAQTAYEGLLSFMHDLNADKPITVQPRPPPSYGFSFSPTQVSKPDLWLTSVTLRLLVETAQLINPDPNVLAGSLNYIMSHQVKLRRSLYYTRSPGTTSRSRRSSCDDITRRSYRKQCQRRRKITKRNLRLPTFSEPLDRKIYLTSVITSELDAIRKVYADWLNGARQHIRTDNEVDRENRILELDDRAVRQSLRLGNSYIAYYTRRIHSTTASPLTLAAAALTSYRASGRGSRILPTLDRTILTFRRSETLDSVVTWYIDSNRSPPTGSLTPKQELQMRSATVEATAYQLQLTALRGLASEKYANWLLKKRDTNNHWVTLRDSLASMQALGAYVARNPVSSPLRVELNNPVNSAPVVINPDHVESQVARESRVSLPVKNNEVSLTTVGRGQAWLELDMEYNVATPKARSAGQASTLSVENPDSLLQSVVSVCPYELSVSARNGPPLEIFYPVESARLRSSEARVSKRLYVLNVNVSYLNPTTSEEDGTSAYVVDVGLGSGVEPVLDDLVMLSNSVEKWIDHYRLTKRSLLLYITGGRDIKFRLTSTIDRFFPDFPVSVYPVAHPEQRCTTFYYLRESSLSLLCSTDDVTSTSSSDVCACAAGSACPQYLSKRDSAALSGNERKIATCDAATVYAYRIRVVTEPVDVGIWIKFVATIRKNFKNTGLTDIRINENQTFWVKDICNEGSKFKRNREYFVAGKTVVQGSDGVYKHLLDHESRIEWWPKERDCSSCPEPKRSIWRSFDFYTHLMPC